MPLWRRIARAVRWLPDRLLHPVRRRTAIARLRGRPNPAHVLYVCHGNICRSPYAAAAFIRALKPDLRSRTRVGSGGFIGPDRPPPAEAVRAAASRGLDLSAHRSRVITAEAVREAELVVVMDPRQRHAVHTLFGKPYQYLLILGDLDPRPVDRRAIRDPFGQPEDIFQAVYDRIDRCIGALVARTHGPVDREASRGD